MIWAKLGSGFTPATASTIVSHMPEKHPAVYILPRAAGSPAGWSASMPWAARAPLPKPSSRPARTIKLGHCQALRPRSGARRTNQTIHQKQTKACQLGHQHSASHSRPANPLTWTRCPRLAIAICLAIAILRMAPSCSIGPLMAHARNIMSGPAASLPRLALGRLLLSSP